LKFEKQNYRALLDSGAEVSLIHRRVYNCLKHKPKLSKSCLNLATASNSPLHIDGFAEIQFKLGGLEMTHKFYVVQNLNRNVIIGLDWLQSRGVRVYHDLGCIRVNGTYVPLVDDIHIASVARLKHKTKIPPQSAHICQCQVRKHPELPTDRDYEITPVESGSLSNEPGLLMMDSVSRLRGNRRLYVMLVNTTNKTFSFKQGTPVASIKIINANQVTSVDKLPNKTEQQIGSIDKADLNKLDNLDVPDKYRNRVMNLIKGNCDLFAQTDAELGHTDTVKMTINTGQHPPIRLRPYRTQLNNRKVIDKAIDEMLEAKVIERSRSAWSFPVVIVGKKDGSKRFCVDFRRLNKVTKSNSYPLPVIDDILALLGKSRYFTSLDLKSGYWQVSMDEKDKEKTAFTCNRGLFHFNVMPFGLMNAPAVFQELMNRVLEGLGHFTTAYLDDIIIYSETEEEHLAHIQQVFDRLREHNLRLKLKKCSFLKEETNYLGFVINKHGIQPEQKKVDVIKSLAPPTNVREVRSFIGCCSYYRRFISEFSRIAEPIINLTRKYARFHWTQECQSAFDQLKMALVKLPLLSFPDTNLPYKLYTDASDKCIGACLTQVCKEQGQDAERPIYFLSHRLSDTQTRWSTIEKEAYAIHYSLQKLDHYLHGAEFTIYCDHKPLKFLLESPIQNRKVATWALCIAGYNCKITYLAGSSNSVADLLSRVSQNIAQTDDEDCPDPDVSGQMYEVNALNSNRFQPKDFARCVPNFKDNVDKPNLGELDMVNEQDKDEYIKQIKRALRDDTLSPSLARKHLLSENILYFISDPDSDPILRLYIPQHIQKKIIEEYHTSLGHMGIDKTYDAIRLKYYWVNLYKDITAYVTTCVTCQTRSSQKTKPIVQETDTPPFAWAKCAIDVSGPYETSVCGNRFIVSFIDLFSGYPEAFACPDKSAQTIAHLIIDELFPRYSCPLEILSDNGSEFLNETVRHTLETLNIPHVKTSYYRPESNGLIERYHRTLVNVISKKIQTDAGSWDMYLNQALAAIRFGVNESTKNSPFRLLYNREVVLPIDNILKPRRKYQGEEPHKIALEQQHKAFLLVHQNRSRAKKRRNEYANKNAKEVDFHVGQAVYYKNNKRKNKLDIKWKPYHRIIEITSPVTYIIKSQLDGSTTKVHAQHLRPANLDDWEIPKDKTGKQLRPSNYVVPPVETSDESDISDTNVGQNDCLKRRYRRVRADSSSEEDIPLSELREKIRSRQDREDRERAEQACRSVD